LETKNLTQVRRNKAPIKTMSGGFETNIRAHEAVEKGTRSPEAPNWQFAAT